MKSTIKISNSFLEAISMLKGVETQVLVMASFMAKTDWTKMYLSCNKNTYEIAETLSISPKSVYNAISSLSKKGLLVKHEKYKGYYHINKDYIKL